MLMIWAVIALSILGIAHDYIGEIKDHAIEFYRSLNYK